MLNYEELRARMGALRADVDAGRISFYELCDAVEAMYERLPQSTTRPSRQELLDAIVEDIQWWCVRHVHEYAKLLVSWKHSKITLHKDGNATIALRSRDRCLMTYRWAPWGGLWSDDPKDNLLRHPRKGQRTY